MVFQQRLLRRVASLLCLRHRLPELSNLALVSLHSAAWGKAVGTDSIPNLWVASLKVCGSLVILQLLPLLTDRL